MKISKYRVNSGAKPHLYMHRGEWVCVRSIISAKHSEIIRAWYQCLIAYFNHKSVTPN